MRLLLLCTALLLATGCRNRTKPAAGGEPAGRMIAVSDAMCDAGGTDTVRFGRLHSGEIAVLPLVLHNASQRTLTITACRRTCGCTTLEYENQPIAPGERRPMKLTFDSRGERGWQFRLLEIRFAGGCKPFRLFVEADVE